MPGYTHLQRAQPVTLGHHLLAWVEMLDRDRTRFAAAAEAAAESPLGAGALAGSTLELPPPPRQMRNSIDAVADRDFVLDYLYAAAVLFTHLSRIGEEIVLWATAEFGFVRLPESAATGSSMMPQKLNPDVAELARGKAGTAIGRLTGLLATVKGLPLAYDRDLQEDKVARRSPRGATCGSRSRRSPCSSAGSRSTAQRLAKAASDPLLLATDAAEALVRKGTPFRDAHEEVAASVRDGSFKRPRKGPCAALQAPAASTMRSPRPAAASWTTSRSRPIVAHEKEIEIRWRDLDGLRHVNNAVYATYLEVGRDELLERCSRSRRRWDYVLVRRRDRLPPRASPRGRARGRLLPRRSDRTLEHHAARGDPHGHGRARGRGRGGRRRARPRDRAPAAAERGRARCARSAPATIA